MKDCYMKIISSFNISNYLKNYPGLLIKYVKLFQFLQQMEMTHVSHFVMNGCEGEYDSLTLVLQKLNKLSEGLQNHLKTIPEDGIFTPLIA